MFLLQMEANRNPEVEARGEKIKQLRKNDPEIPSFFGISPMALL
jgi:hypothetical protein